MVGQCLVCLRNSKEAYSLSVVKKGKSTWKQGQVTQDIIGTLAFTVSDGHQRILSKGMTSSDLFKKRSFGYYIENRGQR